jgi:hypothetical protein
MTKTKSVFALVVLVAALGAPSTATAQFCQDFDGMATTSTLNWTYDPRTTRC